MIVDIKFILITSLICFGINASTWNEMILDFIPKMYDEYSEKASGRLRRFLAFLRNPLFGCVICMSSIQSCVVWLCLGFPFKFYYLPLYILAVAGLNTFILARSKNIFPED